VGAALSARWRILCSKCSGVGIGKGGAAGHVTHYRPSSWTGGPPGDPERKMLLGPTKAPGPEGGTVFIVTSGLDPFGLERW